MSEARSGRKKYGDRGGARRDNPRGGGGRRDNPRRGGPAMLLTCETGREAKCKREGMEILRHYHYPPKTEKAEKALSLEDEIAMLKKGASADQVLKQTDSGRKAPPFHVYDTGCRGTVFVMCTLPKCALIPTIHPPNHQKEADIHAGDKRKADEDPKSEETCKKARDEDAEKAVKAVNPDDEANGPSDCAANSNNNEQVHPPPWDPVDTVARVLNDLTAGSSTAPSSRFVTRMIPIQATCFASLEEIRLTANALVKKYLANVKPSTFAINIKRRNCSNVTRDQVISTLVEEVAGKESDTSSWKVDLKNADYTVHVEICKTLCGMSIIKNCKSFRNFNLVETREAQANGAD